MTPPMNTSSEAGGSGVKKNRQIDDMLLRLGIEEDEFDDFIYEGEAGAPVEGMKWMALAKIHKLPVGYRQEKTIKNLTDKKAGKVVETQLNVRGAGNIVRAKVRLDVRKPLARFVSRIREGVREVYPIKFEKMPRFCGACGFVGHSHLECGTGEFDEDKLKWGDFLKADWDTWFGRGVGGGRGGFSGRVLALLDVKRRNNPEVMAFPRVSHPSPASGLYKQEHQLVFLIHSSAQTLAATTSTVQPPLSSCDATNPARNSMAGQGGRRGGRGHGRGLPRGRGCRGGAATAPQSPSHASSSSSQEDRCFKFLLRIDEDPLGIKRLPDKFAEFGKMYLHIGWDKFTRDLALKPGCQLTFLYEGDNEMIVKVFDDTSCRRHYHTGESGLNTDS
ncbi:hypothetical protein QYE76_033872 [Lolium multiflorum]|uniref:Zinc knuckle CX2CX4HX4C domain-containing protein n=1 Tax=Lolium multiflorum TaxID=4521 RepID=A0AAD8QZH7_LOLMU|nr:hypothetical protein QYE76_033872 [Lolium multiflorum]